MAMPKLTVALYLDSIGRGIEIRDVGNQRLIGFAKSGRVFKSQLDRYVNKLWGLEDDEEYKVVVGRFEQALTKPEIFTDDIEFIRLCRTLTAEVM